MMKPAQERRFLALLFFGIGVPFAMLTAFIAMDTQVDVSELHSRSTDAAGDPIVDWSSLLTNGKTGDDSPANGSTVSIIGYLMDPEESILNGNRTRTFTLLPEPGSIIHPADRHPDQMVHIWLLPGSEQTLRNRSLVWVKGRFQRLETLKNSEPLFALRNATVRPASTADLRLWFRR